MMGLLDNDRLRSLGYRYEPSDDGYWVPPDNAQLARITSQLQQPQQAPAYSGIPVGVPQNPTDLFPGHLTGLLPGLAGFQPPAQAPQMPQVPQMPNMDLQGLFNMQPKGNGLMGGAGIQGLMGLFGQ